jgi:hypothetical protein
MRRIFDQFPDGNRGWPVSITIISSDLSDEELIQNAPLMAISYDHPRKGDDLVIEVGKDQVTYAHTIDLPAEVSTRRNSNGQIIEIWVGDAARTKTLFKLQA